MLERSAGKLARSVLRGLGEREPTWLPGGVCPSRSFLLKNMGVFTLCLVESLSKEYNDVSDTWRL